MVLKYYFFRNPLILKSFMQNFNLVLQTVFVIQIVWGNKMVIFNCYYLTKKVFPDTCLLAFFSLSAVPNHIQTKKCWYQHFLNLYVWRSLYFVIHLWLILFFISTKWFKNSFFNTLPKQIFYMLSLLCHRSVCMFVAGNVWESSGGSGGPSQGNSGAAWNSWGPSLGKPSSAEGAVHASTDHLAQLRSGLLINTTTQV